MRYLTKTAILLVLLIAFSAICVAQKVEEQISKTALENPIAHSSWFDKHFPIAEVLHFEPACNTNSVFLINGYASHKIVNSSIWVTKRANALPIGVKIVFTKQPFDKKDWKTNYYELLANRISEMLLIDSTLNSINVNWEIILQTQAITTLEAERLPHGIEITYRVPQIIKVETKNVKPFKAEISNEIELCIKEAKSRRDSMQSELTDEELKAILYPKSVTQSSVEWQKPQKNAKRNEPGCPTFKTRMEKPRGRLLSRIFR